MDMNLTKKQEIKSLLEHHIPQLTEIAVKNIKFNIAVQLQKSVFHEYVWNVGDLNKYKKSIKTSQMCMEILEYSKEDLCSKLIFDETTVSYIKSAIYEEMWRIDEYLDLIDYKTLSEEDWIKRCLPYVKDQENLKDILNMFKVLGV